MIGLPIGWVVLLIIVLVVALLFFTIYMVYRRYKENEKLLEVTAYLERTNQSWYTYIRYDGALEEELIPVNEAEVTAIEAFFKSIVHNLKGDDIEKRISLFANRHLAPIYEKRLRSSNWGKRMNTLYHIYDFGIDSLTEECRKLANRHLSSEELFLILLIKLKYNSHLFIDDNLQKLNEIPSNDTKELLFNMPDHLFEETVTHHLETLDRKVHYSIVDVIGIKLDFKWVPTLERMYSDTDSELRIRILRAFNELGVIPSDFILADVTNSGVWEERYQTVRMLRRMPKQKAGLIAKEFSNDTSFLVREEARAYLENLAIAPEVLSEVAFTTTKNKAGQADNYSENEQHLSSTDKLWDKKGND